MDLLKRNALLLFFIGFVGFLGVGEQAINKIVPLLEKENKMDEDPQVTATPIPTTIATPIVQPTESIEAKTPLPKFSVTRSRENEEEDDD